MNRISQTTLNRIQTACFFIWPLFVYAPAFVITFGIHNDYSLLPGTFRDLKLHEETAHLVLIGRGLGALLLNIQTFCLNEVAHFTAARIVSWVLMIALLVLFARFLERRLGFDVFWARMIALQMAVVPASQINIILATNLVPGFLALLLAMSSYLTWDTAAGLWAEAKRGRAGFGTAASLGLFLMALFIYPPNALFVFACTFAVVFFSVAALPRRAGLIFRDAVFFGGGMLIYFVVNRWWVIPNAHTWLSFQSMPKSFYAFSVSTDVVQKARLLLDTFLVTLAGVWHPEIGKWGGLITVAVALAGYGVLVFHRRSACEPGQDLGRRAGSALLACAMAAVLFILANLPALIARDCTVVVGYRVLFPGATILLLWQMGVLARAEQCVGGARVRQGLRILAVVLLTASSAVAFRWGLTAARDLHYELNFLEEKLGAVDFQKKNRVMVIMLPRSTASWPAKDWPLLEWDYCRFAPVRISHMVRKIAAERGNPGVESLLDFGDIVFADDTTAVLDMNEFFAGVHEALRAQTGKPIVAIRASGTGRFPVEVSQVTERLLLFHQIRDGERQPFWEIDPREGRAWVEMNFMDGPPQRLVYFAADFISYGNVTGGVECRIYGSPDGQRWADLEAEVISVNGQACFVLRRPLPVRHYRFLLVPRDGADTVRLFGMSVDLPTDR